MSMNIVDRFLEYAEAFDRAVETGDWSAIRSFFTEDAVFESLANPPLDGIARGREAIIERFVTTVEAFDDRFDTRGLKFLEGPEERSGAITARFEARYGTEGAPDLVFTGSMRAEFEGDRMKLLRDTIPPDQVEGLIQWVTAHAGKLAAPDPTEPPASGPVADLVRDFLERAGPA